MKGRFWILALAGSALVALGGSDAQAQYSNGQWRSTPRGTGRQATLKPRPEPQASVFPPVQNGSLLMPLAYRVPIAIVPAVLMSDGSIFANFGFGFEPIVRLCSGGARMGAVVASNGVVLQEAPAVSYTHPAANVLTRSQLLATGLPVHHVIVSDMARLACFSSGASVVYVYR